MFSSLPSLKATEYTEELGKPIIHNYNKYCSRFARKQALLSYITGPFIEEKNGIATKRFSNSGLALSWAKVLNQLGYSVDIIDWDNLDFKPIKKYDLVILHGARNFKNIFVGLADQTPIIHWLTGSYWKFNNTAEDQRLADFKKRHDVAVPRDRYILEPEDPVNKVSKAVIVLGDDSMRQTYPKNLNVITINNASYPDDDFNKYKKNYAVTKNKWLFFAGSGNVHKGLDLLIDSFKDLEQELYIVTVLDRKVLSVYKKELKLPNIHLVGEIGMRSPEFYKIMRECAFVVLPSCSEGQAGSVVESMNQGLIPVVSKETRLDTGEFGVTLKNNSVDCIKETVSKLSGLSSEKVAKMSKKTRATAISDHNPDKFQRDLKKAMKMAVKNH